MWGWLMVFLHFWCMSVEKLTVPEKVNFQLIPSVENQKIHCATENELSTAIVSWKQKKQKKLPSVQLTIMSSTDKK